MLYMLFSFFIGGIGLYVGFFLDILIFDKNIIKNLRK